MAEKETTIVQAEGSQTPAHELKEAVSQQLGTANRAFKLLVETVVKLEARVEDLEKRTIRTVHRVKG